LILVDTSVWVDHFRRADERLIALLGENRVLMHRFVVGEIACGSPRNRTTTLKLLQSLPAATAAADDEALHFIETHAAWGKGLGYVDVHLLASVTLTQGAQLWTRDRSLARMAAALGRDFNDAATH